MNSHVPITQLQCNFVCISYLKHTLDYFDANPRHTVLSESILNESLRHKDFKKKVLSTIWLSHVQKLTVFQDHPISVQC